MGNFTKTLKKPVTFYTRITSGAHLVRFSDIEDIYWYDEPMNNPHGKSIRSKFYGIDRPLEECTSIGGYDLIRIQNYFKNRRILTKEKLSIIEKAKESLQIDQDFLNLVYKAKSDKRQYTLNKFSGNLSMPHYASGSDKIFRKMSPGKKTVTLDLAFQVGTFVRGDYTESFINILKIILMCQALNIKVNIDVFDSDIVGINNEKAYVICNIAKSHERLNMTKILACSHREFFNYTLFNGYSAAGMHTDIACFLDEEQIVEDLSQYYDVIGGNMLMRDDKNSEEKEMVSSIIKIALR